MALISTKNILVPFTNKLHLTTIILVVIAFTILRLSGGEIDIEKQSDVANTLGDTSLEQNQQKTSQSDNSSNRVNKVAPTQNKQNTEKGRPSLDDIEQMF